MAYTPKTYVSRYEKEIQALLNQLNSRKFEYDPEKDTAYQAAKKSLNLAGTVKKDHSLAETSAKTLGFTNSYAKASQGKIDSDTAQSVSSAATELEGAARKQFDKEQTELQKQVKLYQQLEKEEYSRFQKEEAAALKAWQAQEKARAAALKKSTSSSKKASSAAKETRPKRTDEQLLKGAQQIIRQYGEKSAKIDDTTKARMKKEIKTYLSTLGTDDAQMKRVLYLLDI